MKEIKVKNGKMGEKKSMNEWDEKKSIFVYEQYVVNSEKKRN